MALMDTEERRSTPLRKRSRWKRIEPGWYALIGTTIILVNMRDEPHYTHSDRCWEVRDGVKVIDRCRTCPEAKSLALTYESQPW